MYRTRREIQKSAWSIIFNENTYEWAKRRSGQSRMQANIGMLFSTTCRHVDMTYYTTTELADIWIEMVTLPMFSGNRMYFLSTGSNHTDYNILHTWLWHRNVILPNGHFTESAFYCMFILVNGHYTTRQLMCRYVILLNERSI